MIVPRIRLLATLVAVALLAACTAPTTRVILLPQSDGSASAVVVRANNDAEQTLSRPYQRATVSGTRGEPVMDQAEAAKVRQANASLFELLPPATQTYTVYFDIGGAVLTGPSRIVMDSVLRTALERNGGEIVLTGHTDTMGSSAHNDELSRRRAQQVRELFVARGFPAQRIEVVGRGERDLAVRTADEVDEPHNRRVTIEVR